jgi:Lrp/AsnC family transcriptional regulator for asnA, asnC and gidA
MPTSDRIPERILDMLMANSRASFREMAKKLKVSTTTISKAVKEMEKKEIILGYTLDVDWKKLGYGSVLCINIMTKPDADFDDVGKRLRKIPQVKEIFYTTGNTGFSAYVICRDTEEATATISEISRISGVERVVSHMVLKSY